jgi:hypothetical protein
MCGAKGLAAFGYGDDRMRILRRILPDLVAGLLVVVVLLVSFIAFARAESRSGEWWSRDKVRACCSAADAVFADVWTVEADGSIRATVTAGGPANHAWAPIGREYVIPRAKILDEPGNPTGRPILFLAPWDLAHVYCFALGPMI